VGLELWFSVAVEGSRRYTLVPLSKLDVFESGNNVLFEGPSHLMNDANQH
jgi:hypothetical protein